MKYKTFRALVLGGGAVLGVATCGGLYAFSSLGERDTAGGSAGGNAVTPAASRTPFLVRQPYIGGSPTPVAAASAAPGTPAAAAAAVPAGGQALRPMDERILARAAKPVSGDKVKDAFPGERWKVNLYKDAGHAGVNRLKIDLDRDEKWDEKWTFVQDGDRAEVKRQIAPADDEQYSVEYRLRHGAWAPKTDG